MNRIHINAAAFLAFLTAFAHAPKAEPAIGAPSASHRIRTVCLDLDPDLTGALTAQLLSLLGTVPNLRVSRRTAACEGREDAVILSTGSRPLAAKIIPNRALAALPDEGFITRLRTVDGQTVIAIRGRRRTGDPRNFPMGTAYGLFDVMEKLGFSFLHPLEPSIPERIELAPEAVPTVESPRWPIRGIHLHTMHPLELTDLLNGWGEAGPQDAAGFTNMLDEWRSFLTWMLANKLNRVQWVLLSSPKWAAFSKSDTRQRRLTELVEIAHEFGIEVGLDTPIAMRQQNAFRLRTKRASLKEEMAEIRTNIDWLTATGIDFLASENGTSEFTHPDAERMLAWMNGIAEYLDTHHNGKRAYFKIHVSSGQTAEAFDDPVTKGPLNINYLTYYADRRIGVMPHTVEFWGLGDPAPTYGNRDFSAMARYMKSEVGRRKVLWYPETAYWCSFDIDVPLFLPIYADRRLRDLRSIARWEASDEAAGRKIDGQVFFSSGWEWGYWLNDVVAARASWDPLLDARADETAFRKMLSSIFQNFGSNGPALADQITHLATMQAERLIMGANGGRSEFKEQLTGQAYLQGEDALDELARSLRRAPMIALTSTQPNRADILYGQDTPPREIERLVRLLSEMESDFQNAAEGFSLLPRSRSRAHGKIIKELTLSSRVTALRATQARALLDYAAARREGLPSNQLSAVVERSKGAVRRAQALVHEAELLYRVPTKRVAAWKENPTAYRFGYLFTVHNLYYWRRDHRRITQPHIAPCFANLVDPVELAFGIPADGPGFSLIRKLSEMVLNRDALNACLTASEFIPPGETPPVVR